MAGNNELVALPRTVTDFLRLNKYTDPVVIGMGKYGRVARANYNYPDGRKVRCAVKVIFRQNDDGNQEKLFTREWITQSLARHRNVVQHWEHFRIPSAFIISMQWCSGGTLDEYIKSLPEKKYTPLLLALSWCKDLMSGLHYIYHYLDICHRDLKPENILFDGSQRLKIADFGYAKVNPGNLNTICGSPLFMAPELIRNPGPNHDPYKCDVWGWGLISYLIFTKSLPFSPKTLSGEGPLDITPKLDRALELKRLPVMMYNSLNNALQEDPTDRPTLCAIRARAWYSQVQSPPPNPPPQQQQQPKGQKKK